MRQLGHPIIPAGDLMKMAIVGCHAIMPCRGIHSSVVVVMGIAAKEQLAAMIDCGNDRCAVWYFWTIGHLWREGEAKKEE